MSTDDLPGLDDFLRATAPAPEPVQREMADRADDEGFPIIGPVVGGVLYQLALLADAAHVFEFGSGFGYSASWFARALPDDGRIVLTEEDEDELAAARDYLDAAGYADRARFEHGDAMATIERYDGPFDVVLIDHAKEAYADAFHAVRPKVSPGGVVVADNAISAGPMDTEGLLRAVVAGESGDDLEGMAAGVHRYLEAVRDDGAFVTAVLPIGSGIAVSVRRPD